MRVLSLKNIQINMTKEEIISKLTTIVKPYVQNEEGFKNLNENTDFINDLEINSANLVDIILDVEDEFSFKFLKPSSF